MSDLKARLLAPRLPEGDVEIGGVGTVRVRALTRAELLHVGRLESKGPAAMERYTLACAMLDPAMTEDDVAAWQQASPAAELNVVSEKVNELSGIAPGAPKEAYKSVRGEPGS